MVAGCKQDAGIPSVMQWDLVCFYVLCMLLCRLLVQSEVRNSTGIFFCYFKLPNLQLGGQHVCMSAHSYHQSRGQYFGPLGSSETSWMDLLVPHEFDIAIILLANSSLHMQSCFCLPHIHCSFSCALNATLCSPSRHYTLPVCYLALDR